MQVLERWDTVRLFKNYRIKSKHQSSQQVKTMKLSNMTLKDSLVQHTVLVGNRLTKWLKKQIRFFSLVQTSHLLKFKILSQILINSFELIITQLGLVNVIIQMLLSLEMQEKQLT